MLFRTRTTPVALFILTVICFQTLSHAQLNVVTIGDASDLGNNCFEITPDQGNKAGGVWYDNPIDFANDFTIYYQNNFGTKDSNGADGMALVFKKNADAEIGGTGQGIGYAGIDNTLIVEFDTFQNGGEGDLTEDHIGIMSNGNANHSASTSLAGPIQASATNANIEDGINHEIKIVWIAGIQTLNVYFDCDLRLSATNDVKTTIFNGDDSVYFGFVGSTGGFSNLHQVCFNRVSFVANLNLVDTSICSDETIQLDATIPSGVSYSWSPTTGVSDPTIANPTFSPTNTTNYTVTISDVCGDVTTEDVLITLNSYITPSFPASAEFFCDGNTNPLTNTSNEGITGSWSPAFDSTTTATYTFTPDAGQCADPATLTVVVDARIIPTFSAINDICDGETLDPLPTTSNEGISGTWSPAIDNTVTTTYTFTPDAGQCADTTDLEVRVVPLTVTDFAAIAPICVGSANPLLNTSVNGITGAWSPAFDNTTTTTYTFTPDANQCADTTDLEVTITPLTVPDFAAIAPICVGSANPLLNTSVNGITGAWSPAFDNTTTTTYTFTPDANQCADTTDLEVTITPLTVPDFAAIAPICVGSANPLLNTSVNGITGMWDPAFDNTTTTTYTFRPGANQCADTTDLEVVITPLIVPDFAAIAPICVGSANPLLNISLDGIMGGWSPAFDDTTTTTYTFTPDANQCADTTDLEVVITPLIVPDFAAIAPICVGSANPLLNTSVNGITGAWSPAFDNTTTTTYTFTPDANQCADTTDLEVTITPLIVPDFAVVAPICVGSANPLLNISLDGITGGWSPAFDDTTTTTYTFTPDANQCANTASMTVVVNQKIVPTFTHLTTICEGDASTLLNTSNEGVTGDWSPAFDNTVTASYTFTPFAGQCAGSISKTITVNPLVTPIFTQVDPICIGGVLLPLPTTSTNGTDGTWSPAIDNMVTTEYTFTPTPIAGICFEDSKMTIVVLPQITPLFTQVDPICVGSVLMPLPTVSVDGITGRWSPAMSNVVTTTYMFSPDPNQCADPTTMTIVVNPINTLTVSATILSEDFDANQIISVSVTGGSGTYEYQLDGGVWQSSAVFENVLGCNEHTVAVRDALGCSTIPEEKVMIMTYPKFFTPNGDGFNDSWNIECLRKDSSAVIRIFDRFGKLLIQFKPSQSAWSGAFNGAQLTGTDYWFTADYLNSVGVKTQFKAHFSLKR